MNWIVNKKNPLLKSLQNNLFKVQFYLLWLLLYTQTLQELRCSPKFRFMLINRKLNYYISNIKCKFPMMIQN